MITSKHVYKFGNVLIGVSIVITVAMATVQVLKAM